MKQWRVGLGVLALLVSVLSGKMGIPASLLGLEVAPIWADLRFASAAGAAVFLWPEIRDLRAIVLGRPALIFVLLLCALLFIRSFFDVSAETPEKRIDNLLMIAQMLIGVAVVQHRDARHFAVQQILLIAGVYLLIAIGGQVFEAWGASVNYGLGWGPIGGPITFNRIQFLAACVAMCMAVGTNRRRLFYTLLATVFFFATIASLQKAAIAAAFLGIVVVGTLLVATNHWRRALPLILIVVVAVGGFAALYGDRLSGRLTNLSIPSPGTPEQGDLSPFYVTEFGVLVQYCSSPSADIAAIDQIPCRTMRYADRTSRLTFTSEAIIGFLNNPIFGNGIGNFLITVVHPDTLLPDTYRYPHNLILEVAFDAGLIGLSVLLIAMTAAAVTPFSSAAPLQVRTYVGLFMVFLFTNTMFAGDFYDSRMLWLGGIALAFWPKPASAKSSEVVAN